MHIELLHHQPVINAALQICCNFFCQCFIWFTFLRHIIFNGNNFLFCNASLARFTSSIRVHRFFPGDLLPDFVLLHEIAVMSQHGGEQAQRGQCHVVVVILHAEQPAHHHLHRLHLRLSLFRHQVVLNPRLL